MNTIESESQKTPKRNNTTLWIMVFLFGLPYLAAYFFYFNRDTINLGEQTNHGTIVHPAKPVTDKPLKLIDGTNFQVSDLKGKWVMLSIGSSECKEACQDNIYKIRQIKKALAAEHKRVEKLYFLLDLDHIDSFRDNLKDYKGMHVVSPEADDYTQYLSIFSIDNHTINDGIYIIDPLGNYMMMYPPGEEPKNILKDMERLLKVSKIG